MADLNETTLTLAIPDSASTRIACPIANISKNDLIWCDGEAMLVRSVDTNPTTVYPIAVVRGMAGTAAAPHGGGAPIISGNPGRFHSSDPVGLPAATPIDNPWVNTRDRRVWRAQGDQVGPGILSTAHYWALQQPVSTIGALGVRLTVQVPNSTP